jgi:hypothetical protein
MSESRRSLLRARNRAFLLAAIVSSFLSGCAEPIHTVAQRPLTNVLAATRLHGTYSLNLQDVPDDEYCSHTEGIVDFCVSHFRSAYKFGLDELLQAFVARGPGPRLVAKFKLVDFSHSPAAVSAAGVPAAAYVHMRWQFTLTDESGAAIVAMATSTRGPKAVANPDDVAPVIRALIETTLEEIANTLNAQLKAPPSAPVGLAN